MTEARHRAAEAQIYDPIVDTPTCYLREPEGVHPPLDYPPYKSTPLRHPKQPLVYLPQTITEITGPAARSRRGSASSTTTSRASTRASRSASGSSSRGRVFDTEGKPLRGTLVEVWQANAAGRYRHRWDRWPAPLDPNFTGAGRCVTDDEGRYRFSTIKPGPVPVGQPLQRLAPRAHPLLAARPRVRAAAGDADVLPRRPVLPLRPDLQLGPRRARRASGWSRASRSTRPQPDWALAYELDIYLRGPGATPFEEAL